MNSDFHIFSSHNRIYTMEDNS